MTTHRPNSAAVLDTTATPRRLSSHLQRTTVHGKWQLGARLGGGSTSEVHAARPVDASSECEFLYAIKCLRDEEAACLIARQRFRNEVVLGRRLSHPNLIAVLSASIESAPYYYVMPRLWGATLEEQVRDGQRIAIPHALWIARQVADGISALHQLGWVHGDIHPKNVYVSADSHVTVMDLGCATPVTALDGNHRKILTGCLYYVAPEQLTSRYQATPASDVYSLGLVLFQMLTGHLPSRFDDPGRIAEYHLREMPPSIRTWLPTAPRELARLLVSMLAKDPSRRPSTDGELQTRLARLEIETFASRTR